MENSNQIERYKKAQKKVKDIKEFYSHLIWYVIIICLLVFLNLKYSPEHLWFFYPLIGWGFGVIGHALGVFGDNLWFSKDWEENKIKSLMEKEKETSNQNWE